MKQALAIVGVMFVTAYVAFQVLFALLQPLLIAFAGKLH